MMNRRHRGALQAAVLALATLAGAPAPAQDDTGVDDVMMSVIDEDDANEQSFAEEIGVPAPGGEQSPRDGAGRDTADEARELRHESADRPEAVRDLGRDAGETGSDRPGQPD